MHAPALPPLAAKRTPRWPAALVWAGCAALLAFTDGHTDLASQALLLVLAAALSALWLSATASVVACAYAVLAFNWSLVPPRGSLSVNLAQHVVLLATMLGVAWVVALAVARQRALAAEARRHAIAAELLRGTGEALRDAPDPWAWATHLQDTLGHLAGVPVCLLALRDTLPPDNDADSVVLCGEVDAQEQAGLWQCLRDGQAFGAGTGRYEVQDGLYLPLRARQGTQGSALLRVAEGAELDGSTRATAQALCDQFGQALERAQSQRRESASRAAADLQALRNTLLAAMAHDYRTPLATILGAASALQAQGSRLSAAQQLALADTIGREAQHLGRMTDNSLQLARLDAPGVELRMDWESAEEIVGSAAHAARARMPGLALHVQVQPELPLLRCDAVLLQQLLANLIDNAVKYAGSDAPIELHARRIGPELLLAVADRGPGVPAAWRTRIFEPFQRADVEPRAPEPGGAPAARGAGIGLALCQAIARAHGGRMVLRHRTRGGSSFECHLPVHAVPVHGAPTEPPA